MVGYPGVAIRLDVMELQNVSQVTTELPRSVTSVNDLVDHNFTQQGEPGYSNPPVHIGDFLKRVDGFSVEVSIFNVLQESRSACVRRPTGLQHEGTEIPALQVPGCLLLSCNSCDVV